jgi:nucleotide-binding universal stress UspA family protein
MNSPRSQAVLGRVKLSYPRLRLILVPLDFSGKSRQALRHAVPLAVKFGARIVLAHVLDLRRSAAAPAALLGRTPAEQKAAARRRLLSVGSQLIPAELLADPLVLSGSPAPQIVAAAERLDADLIVISTKGRTGLRRMLVGSTAENVMQRARCPVLSVRRS